VFRANVGDNAGGLLLSNSSDCSTYQPHTQLPPGTQISRTAEEYLAPSANQPYSSLVLNVTWQRNTVQLDGGAMYVSTANAPTVIDT
jgi:hypothetical protein